MTETKQRRWCEAWMVKIISLSASFLFLPPCWLRRVRWWNCQYWHSRHCESTAKGLNGARPCPFPFLSAWRGLNIEPTCFLRSWNEMRDWITWPNVCVFICRLLLVFVFVFRCQHRQKNNALLLLQCYTVRFVGMAQRSQLNELRKPQSPATIVCRQYNVRSLNRISKKCWTRENRKMMYRYGPAFCDFCLHSARLSGRCQWIMFLLDHYFCSELFYGTWFYSFGYLFVTVSQLDISEIAVRWHVNHKGQKLFSYTDRYLKDLFMTTPQAFVS